MKTNKKTNATIHIIQTGLDFLDSLPGKLEGIAAKVPDGWHRLRIAEGAGIEFFPELLEAVETAQGIKEAISTVTISSLTIIEEITEVADNPDDLKRKVEFINRRIARITPPDFSVLRNLPSVNKLLSEGLIKGQFLRDIDSIIIGIGFYKEQIIKAIEDLDEDPTHPSPIELAKDNHKYRNDTLSRPKDTILNNPIAIALLSTLNKEGFVDSSYLWINEGHTNYERATAAQCIGVKAKIENYYKCFEDLWNCKYLSSDRSKANNLVRQKAKEKVEVIEKLFGYK